jgi:hypothetical protein
MAGVHNFSTGQGETFSRTLIWEVDSIPVVLDGFTARMQVRRSVGSPSTLVDLSSDGEGIVLGDEGTISLLVSASVMSSVVSGSHVYDLELDSGGEVTTLLRGAFIVEPEVTR